MITIPAKDTKKFSQPNYGDTQGNLWGTYNVDLSKNTGRVRVPRIQAVYSGEDGDGFTLPRAFAYFDFNNTGTKVFITYAQHIYIGGSSPIATFTKDVSTNSPLMGSYGDMKVFNGKLYATDTKLKRIAPGAAAWTDITSLTGYNNGQLCDYKDKLYFITANSKKIYSMNLDESINVSGAYTLNLSFINGNISWIKAGSNRIWIGITTDNGTNGSIYEWDGQSENIWSKNYTIEAQGSAGCAIWNDIPYVMDIEGRLLAFNGANFQEVARLPLMEYDSFSRAYATPFPTKICHFNGIQYINDEILINVNNETSGTSTGKLENFPAGVYSYTKENGLIHKYAASATLINQGTTDYGFHKTIGSGAIFDASVSTVKIYNYSTVMFGSNLKDKTGGNDLSYINVDVIDPREGDQTHKRLGYIITPFIESQKVTDVWKKIIVKYRKMLDSTDKILVKYRTTKDTPVTADTIVWQDSTSFKITSTTGINVGDEVEVLTGNGAGAIGHITTIVNNGSDYTITLDTSILGVTNGDKSDIRVQSWKKLPEINRDEFQFKELSVPQYNKDTEIQFKVVMNWANKDNELREIIIVNDTEQYAK